MQYAAAAVVLALLALVFFKLRASRLTVARTVLAGGPPTGAPMGVQHEEPEHAGAAPREAAPPRSVPAAAPRERSPLFSGLADPDDITQASDASLLRYAFDAGQDDAVEAILGAIIDDVGTLDAALRDEAFEADEATIANVLVRVQRRAEVARELHRRHVTHLEGGGR
jgi:hypothetical protein